MVEVGDTVYLEEHAYFHVIGEVTEILGTRRVSLKNASKIHNCARGWEDFFRDGHGTDTTYDFVGEIMDCTYIDAIRWNHPLPEPHAKKGGHR